MTCPTVTICRSCPLGQSDFAERLQARLGTNARVATRDCMSGCARPSTVAIRAPGKTAYLFGDLSPDAIPLIETFLQHYAASPTGDFRDARVLGDLRVKAIARIPGSPKSQPGDSTSLCAFGKRVFLLTVRALQSHIHVWRSGPSGSVQMGTGKPEHGKAPTAPATVCGELLSKTHCRSGNARWEGERQAMTRESGDRPQDLKP